MKYTITLVKPEHRKSALSLIPGGVEVILTKINGNKVIYDNVKSAKGFCNKIIKRCTETGEIKSIKSIVDSEGTSWYTK